MEPRTNIIIEMLYTTVLTALPVLRAIDANLYCQAQSLIIEAARVLGKECPIVTRKDRRGVRANG